MCFGPDSGGLALYLSPRASIDVTAALAPTESRKRGYQFDSERDVDDRPFDWVIAAGQIGPLGKDGEGPWPMHPRWITDIAVASAVANVPFCVPHLGEWTCYDHRRWEGDHTVSGEMSSDHVLDDAPTRNVNFDPTWQWGERGWDAEHHAAKPADANMQAVGSQLVGRALVGRIFDEWPLRSWHRR